jgi:hypothetical protein
MDCYWLGFCDFVHVLLLINLSFHFDNFFSFVGPFDLNYIYGNKYLTRPNL